MPIPAASPRRPRSGIHLTADDRGLSTVEYVMVLVLIAAVAVGVWQVFGETVRCALIRATPMGNGELPEGAGRCFVVDEGPAVGAMHGSRRALESGSSSRGSFGCDGSSTPKPAPTPAPKPNPAPKPSPAPAPKPPATAAEKFVASIHPLMCPKDANVLLDLKKAGTSITVYDEVYFEDQMYDGSKWVMNKWPAGGSEDTNAITVVMTSSADDNAGALFHEAVHARQPASMQPPDNEVDAYTKEAQWRIDRGLSGGHVTTDASGKNVVDHDAINGTINTYPGVIPDPKGGKPHMIVGMLPDGKLKIKRPNGTTYTRAPRKGDTLPGKEVANPPGGSKVDLNALPCP
jgi:Flp pilus assembly pilin Flp